MLHNIIIEGYLNNLIIYLNNLFANSVPCTISYIEVPASDQGYNTSKINKIIMINDNAAIVIMSNFLN